MVKISRSEAESLVDTASLQERGDERGFDLTQDESRGSNSVSTGWDDLSEELRDRVLALLPLHCLFRCRAVCKAWNRTVDRPGFRRLYDEVTSDHRHRDENERGAFCPMLFSVNIDGGLTAFDPRVHRWRKFPSLSFLPYPGSFSLVESGDGGLLCVRCPPSSLVVVCNPMTRTWKELPMSNHKIWANGDITQMIFNRGTNCYTIVAAQARSGMWTEVYESSSGTWSVKGKPPSSIVFTSRSTAVVQGVMYCAARDITDAIKYPYQYAIVAFDLASGSWSQFLYLLPSEYQDPPHVVDCVGKLFVIAARRSENAVDILNLEPIPRRWIKVSAMPQSMYGQVHSITRSHCVANGTCICLTNVLLWQVVVYDVNDDSWKSLPQYPFNHDALGTFTLSFEPRLSSPV